MALFFFFFPHHLKVKEEFLQASGRLLIFKVLEPTHG